MLQFEHDAEFVFGTPEKAEENQNVVVECVRLAHRVLDVSQSQVLEHPNGWICLFLNLNSNRKLDGKGILPPPHLESVVN